jgi:hypothetical protein
VTAWIVGSLAYTAPYEFKFLGYRNTPAYDDLPSNLKSRDEKLSRLWGDRIIRAQQASFGPNYLSLVRSYLLRPLAAGLIATAVIQIATLTFVAAATVLFPEKSTSSVFSMYGQLGLLVVSFPAAFMASVYLGIAVISGFRKTASAVLSGIILISIPPIFNLFITGHFPKNKEALTASLVAAAITGIAGLVADHTKTRIERSSTSLR